MLRSIAATKLSVNPKIEGYPFEGCFGYIGGHLILGEKHHQEMIARLLDAGWTWDQLMNAKQAWGWYIFGGYTDWDEDEWYEVPAATEWDWRDGYIELSFTSDAAMQKGAIGATVAAFKQLFGLPVYYESGEASGVTKENYGEGLTGKEKIDTYLQGKQWDLTGEIPPPPSA